VISKKKYDKDVKKSLLIVVFFSSGNPLDFTAISVCNEQSNEYYKSKINIIFFLLLNFSALMSFLFI